MVSATENPQTLRVSFTYDESHTTQFEIVCLVRPCFDGIDILYSHHLHRVRNVGRGPWTDQASMGLQLTPRLIGIIQQGVMLELFSKFGSRVRPLQEVSSEANIGDTEARITELEGRRVKLVSHE